MPGSTVLKGTRLPLLFQAISRNSLGQLDNSQLTDKNREIKGRPATTDSKEDKILLY